MRAVARGGGEHENGCVERQDADHDHACDAAPDAEEEDADEDGRGEREGLFVSHGNAHDGHHQQIRYRGVPKKMTPGDPGCLLRLRDGHDTPCATLNLGRTDARMTRGTRPLRQRGGTTRRMQGYLP